MLVNRLGFSVVNPDVPATSDGEVEWSAWIARQLGGVAEAGSCFTLARS